jgi:hypothetical protein
MLNLARLQLREHIVMSIHQLSPNASVVLQAGSWWLAMLTGTAQNVRPAVTGSSGVLLQG